MTKKPTKPVAYTKLFAERMQREGRLGEFRKRIKQLGDTEGLKYGQAFRKLMPEFGYEGAQKERELERQWIAGLDYERAMAFLPDSAPADVETQWVKSHPAMVRKIFSDNPEEKIRLTSADLYFAPHGRCPSKAAAVMLARLANSDKAIDANLAAGVKKAVMGEASASAKQDEAIVDDGLEEIRRMIKETTG